MLRVQQRATDIPRDPAPVVFELPGGVDERVHLCSVGAVERAQRENRGRYVVLCGEEILAGSVASRSESTCSSCFAQPHRRPGRQDRSGRRDWRARRMAWRCAA